MSASPLTSPLALTSGESTLWAVLLGVGVVVLVVVIVLLTMLLRLVVDIDDGVKAVWRSAGRLAANTATTWQLQNSLHATRQLQDEIRRHDQLLERL